jgi:Fur family ferric uptake transcriptional regulator
MSKVSASTERLSGALAAAGYRLTKPRLAVIEAVSRARRMLSTDEILARARRIHPRVGLATVYRCIDMLDRIGYFQRVQISGKGYVTACHDEKLHYHLVCRECRAVTEVEVAQSTDALQRLMIETGFRAQAGAIEVIGLCQACRSPVERIGRSNGPSQFRQQARRQPKQHDGNCPEQE